MGNRSISRYLRKLVFSVSLSEADYSKRGFHCSDGRARKHFERIGETAIAAFNLALDEPQPEGLGARLEAEFDRELWGYAYEGAAMALTVLDCLSPWQKHRARRFAQGPGAAHIEIVHVGIGFSLARLHRRVEPAIPRFDPLFGRLVLDGWGFHEGYYHLPRCRREGGPASGLPPHASRRVFDQGLGRSLWFTQCAEVERISNAIAKFPLDRAGDLWSGIGLACAYAGGADRPEIEALGKAAGTYQAQLAEGASFGAKARQRGRCPSSHTSMACEVLCGKSAEDAAAVVDEALSKIKLDQQETAYLAWRRQVLARYETPESAAARLS
jgi:enediyne biosynthesis protein E3